MLAAGQKSCQISANNLNECVHRHTNTFVNINKSDSGTRMLILRFYHLTAPVGYENLFSQNAILLEFAYFRVIVCSSPVELKIQRNERGALRNMTEVKTIFFTVM
jgi:hypothetical protein